MTDRDQAPADSTRPAPDREHLRRLTWAALERKAIDAGVRLGLIRQAKTRAELIDRICEATQ